MAEGKYCNINGAIKQIVGEYCNIGGVIKQGTINAVNIGGAIKQISVGEKQIFACEQGSDRLYGINDAYTDLAGWPIYGVTNPRAVACDDKGNSYWASTTNVYKYNLAGTLQWTYSGHTSNVISICLENRGGATYIYTGDTGGTVKCIFDGTVIAGLVWTQQPYASAVYGLAFDGTYSQLYAAYADGHIRRFQTALGIWSNIFYDGSISFYSIAIGGDILTLYVGDSSGHIRKISTTGHTYWDVSRSGEIVGLVIGFDGDGYYVNGSGGDVGKFITSDGGTYWIDTPSGTSQAVAVDEFGNVYSTHGAYGSENAVIRKNSNDGVERWTWQPYINSLWQGIAVSPGLKAAGY